MENNKKQSSTNTFWVNPNQTGPDAHDYIIPGISESVTGVTFPHPSYKDGIEAPDKLVTVNGATNYHLLDAINIDWDGAAIPWAKKITKWGGSGDTIDEEGNIKYSNRTDVYAPNYKYNKPNEGWVDGTIRETEDIVDILNYLIYRVVSIDYFIDHWNDEKLKPAALRLVNHRTNWYVDVIDESGKPFNPDYIDGDRSDESEEQFNPDYIDGDRSVVRRAIGDTMTLADKFKHMADNRITVQQNIVLVVNLYPYLVSSYWVDPKNPSYKVKLFDSKGNPKPGVVVCDTGLVEQRKLIYKKSPDDPIVYRKIVSGHENFDIFDVETLSNSNQVKFTSESRNVLDGLVQGFTCLPEKTYEQYQNEGFAPLGPVDDEAIVDESTQEQIRETIHLYRLPIVAYKCLNTQTYPFNTFDVIRTLLRYNYISVQNRTASDRKPEYTSTTPQFDPTSAKVSFHVSIDRTTNAADGIGYVAQSNAYEVKVYKGDNTLKDFKLLGSVKDPDGSMEIIDSITREPLVTIFYDSFGKKVKVKKYETILNPLPNNNVYNDPNELNKYKFKIIFESEFGPAYDSTHTGNDEEILKKSFVYPYFVVKSADALKRDYVDICNAVNVDDYKYIYSSSFNKETSSSFTLFDHPKYGKIIYEKNENEWCYFYLPPVINQLVETRTITENVEDSEHIVDESVTCEHTHTRTQDISLFDDAGEYRIKLMGLMYYAIDDVTTNRLLNPLWAELNITIKNTNQTTEIVDGQEFIDGGDNETVEVNDD